MGPINFQSSLDKSRFKMPKQINEIKDFLLTARRTDAKSVKIKKNKTNTKFKVRCSKYLYTLVIEDQSVKVFPASYLEFCVCLVLLDLHRLGICMASSQKIIFNFINLFRHLVPTFIQAALKINLKENFPM